MLTTTEKPINTTLWFTVFVTIYLVVWTLVPSLVRSHLPLDVLEGTVWAQSFEWGYDRDPGFRAWLTGVALWLGGGKDWVLYLFSQLSVAVCFAATWRLGCRFLHPFHALVGVMILIGFQYYNIAAIDFNDNVLPLSLWALACLYFYDAVTEQKLTAWILVGIFTDPVNNSV